MYMYTHVYTYMYIIHIRMIPDWTWTFLAGHPTSTHFFERGLHLQEVGGDNHLRTDTVPVRKDVQYHLAGGAWSRWIFPVISQWPITWIHFLLLIGELYQFLWGIFQHGDGNRPPVDNYRLKSTASLVKIHHYTIPCFCWLKPSTSLRIFASPCCFVKLHMLVHYHPARIKLLVDPT